MTLRAVERSHVRAVTARRAGRHVRHPRFERDLRPRVGAHAVTHHAVAAHARRVVRVREVQLTVHALERHRCLRRRVAVVAALLFGSCGGGVGPVAPAPFPSKLFLAKGGIPFVGCWMSSPSAVLY